MKFKILIVFVLVLQNIKAQSNLKDTSWYQLIYIDSVEFSINGLCYFEFIKDNKTYQVLSDESIDNKSLCLTSLKVGYLYNIDLKEIYTFFLKDSTTAFEYLKFAMYGKQNCISVGGNKHVYECESINHNKILCSVNVEYGFYEDLRREQRCKEIKKRLRRGGVKKFLRHPFGVIYHWVTYSFQKLFYKG